MRDAFLQRIGVSRKSWTGQRLRRLCEEVLLLAGFLLTSSWLVRG
jgi:hypothetical protein